MEPMNAITKQYGRFMELDGVELIVVTPDGALKAIAREAIKRRTGARALRSIVEEVMMNLMYELPSSSDVKRCVITEAVVERREEPTVLTVSDLAKAS